MNPLVSAQYAWRLLICLAAIISIFFTAGCGSGGAPAQVNPVGFSNSSLTGTYVFSSEGEDSNFGFISVAGALVANGSGGITGGTMDILDTAFTPPSPVAQAITKGSYSVSKDGRGKVSLTSSVGTIVLDFVLISGSHGLVTEFDGNGTGSGTIDLQTAVPSLAQLAAPFAFSFGGIDINFNTLATAGSFTLNSSGTITAGVQDFNDGGIPFANQSLTGAATVGSGTGPGAMTLTSTLGSLTFDFYPIDANHLKFIETDFGSILVGDAFSQTGASIPTGSMVFTMTGGVNAPVAVGGLMTSDGSGNFTAGLEDFNNNGIIAQVPFSGIAAPGGSIGGRVLVNLAGAVPATQWAIYPSSGGLLMIETDAANVTLGAAYAQTSQTLAASQNYGFNLDAFNTSAGFEEDDLAQFTTTSTAFTGVVDINDDAALSFGQTFGGTYTLDSPATGRGEATTTAGGSGFVSFTFYVVNSSTILLLETDTNQIGTGMFQLQSVPSGAVAQSHLSIMPPAVRAHAAHSFLRHR
jgi:hypothetical protein